MKLEIEYQREVDDHVVIVIRGNTVLFEKIAEDPIKGAKSSHSSCVSDEICELGIHLPLKKEGELDTGVNVLASNQTRAVLLRFLENLLIFL